MTLEQHLSAKHVAEKLDLKETTVLKWCQATEKRPALLRSVMIGGARRIPVSEVERLLAEARGGTKDNVRPLRRAG